MTSRTLPTRAPDVAAESPQSDRGKRWLSLGEVAIAAALASLTFLVHNVSYVLTQPLWLDEAWVADSTRAPLHLVTWLTSSTPLGWTLLLRLVPGSGEQRFRLVTLAFAALAVLVAYALGRELGLMRIVTPLLVAASVLLAPALLFDDELKQYTAEACASIVVLLLVARVETSWSRRRLVVLATVSGVALLFTNTVMFVGVAAVASLALVALAQRRWKNLAEVATAGAIMLAIQGAIYLAIDKPHQIPSLAAYWRANYIPHNEGMQAVFSFFKLHGAPVTPYLGFHASVVSLVLALGGIATLIWVHRTALALTTPLTIVAVMIASTFRKYPFLDLRTSTFWLIMVVVLMAIGAAGAVRLLQSRSVLVAVVVATAALGFWCYSTSGYVRSTVLPTQDVRAQIAYFNAHHRTGDILVLSYTTTFEFAYYEPRIMPTYRHISYAATGFLPTYPNVSWIVDVMNNYPADVITAWHAAQVKAAQHPGARIWIILPGQPAQLNEWDTLLVGRDASFLPVGGPQPLVLVPSA